MQRAPSRDRVDTQIIEEVLNIRNSKWTVPVVLHLRTETLRFTELQRSVGRISQKTLTITLRTLEREGFVTRTSYPTIPPRVDYALTELGSEALRMFEVLEQFASRHGPRVLEARRQFDASHGQ